jgi:A/G-specific adenine glycosylase
MIRPTDRARFRRRLLAWYDREARDLPWRRTRDPYRLWVSEMMLQQTQVATVLPYYRRFLAAFPNVFRLAAASEDAVLKRWEGLGYYARARQMLRAARTVAAAGGRFPTGAQGWRELPGVGPYTAGALASIADGEAAPIVDGNVRRVLARFFALSVPLDAPRGSRRVWALARDLVPAHRPGDFNQALMELGARLCRPRAWLCPDCPLEDACRAAALGRQDRFPVRRVRPARPHHEVVAAVLDRNGRYLVGRRPAHGLLGGLWEFPGGKVQPGESLAAALRREVREELGTRVAVGAELGRVEHGYTHYSVTLHGLACRLTGPQPQALHHSALRWVTRSELDRLALPQANRRLLQLIDAEKPAVRKGISRANGGALGCARVPGRGSRRGRRAGRGKRTT